MPQRTLLRRTTFDSPEGGMMLRSIFTKTLRGYWVAIVGWGGGLGLLAYAMLLAYATQFNTPQQRQEFAFLAEKFRFFAEPVSVTTPAGFVTWRTFGFLPVLLGIWAALAGARLTRREEERGALDIVLAQPRSRGRFLAEALAALTVALIAIGLLIGLGALGGASVAGESVAVGAALLAGLNVALIDLLFALLAALIAQFVGRAGTAAGIAGGLLVVSWALDGATRVVQGGAWLGWLTPFHLYNRSKPLIADYGAHPPSLLGLVALALVCGALSFPLFGRRDLGGVAWRGRRLGREAQPGVALDRAGREIGLRGVGLMALRANGPGVAGWIVGLGALTLFIVAITRATKDTLSRILSGSPAFLHLFAGRNLASDAGFLAGILFFFLPLTIAFYALAIAVGWARDLDGGYYELPLGTPTPRWRLFLGSWGATLGGLLLAPLALWLISLAGIAAWDLSIARGDLLVAFIGLLAIELPVAAFVYLVAGRLGAGATLGLGGGALVLFFALGLVGPLLGLPEWVLGLSLFHQFGTPLTAVPRWSAWAALVAIAGVFLIGGLIRFERGDVQRGN